jgi:hypothetical protein
MKLWPRCNLPQALVPGANNGLQGTEGRAYFHVHRG